MNQAERDRTTRCEPLRKAREALAQDDLLQAFEKGWGAACLRACLRAARRQAARRQAAQAVKAVAESRGWPHNSHRDLFEVVRRLVQETGERRTRQLFLTATAPL